MTGCPTLDLALSLLKDCKHMENPVSNYNNTSSLKDALKLLRDHGLLYALDINAIEEKYSKESPSICRILKIAYPQFVKESKKLVYNTQQLLPPLLEKINSVGIRYIIAKGLAYVYWFGWDRPFSDIDIWVADISAAMRLHNILKNSGFSCSQNGQIYNDNDAIEYLLGWGKQDTHLLSYERDGLVIEMHQPAGNPVDYGGIISNAVTNHEFAFPDLLDMLVISCEHAWQHFFKNFNGLTWITADSLKHYYDVYLTYNMVRSSFTPNQILNHFSKRWATNIAVCILQITEDIFGEFVDTSIRSQFSLISYPKMFPSKQPSLVEALFYPQQTAQSILSDFNRPYCIVEHLNGKKISTTSYTTLSANEGDYWPCHIFSDLGFMLKSADVTHTTQWDCQSFYFNLHFTCKNFKLAKDSENGFPIINFSLLFADTKGKRYNVMLSIHSNDIMRAFVGTDLSPVSYKKSVKGRYNCRNGHYSFCVVMPWETIGIPDMSKHCDPLFFDYLISFMPDEIGSTMQYVAWASGCGMSFWPPYYMRTFSEMKFKKLYQ